MDTDQFLMAMLTSVNGNTNVISELRRVIDQLPVRSEFKDSEELCTRVDLAVKDIKESVDAIVTRLDTIDKWQKVRLPLIIGTITLLLYAIGFFFTLDRVADMIEARHTAPITAPQM